MRVDEFKQAYMLCKPTREEIALLTEYINANPADYEYSYDDIDRCRYGNKYTHTRDLYPMTCRGYKSLVFTHSDGVWGLAKTTKHYNGGNSGRKQDC